MMISRNEALILLRECIKNEKLIQHCLASEAVMKALARKLGQNEEKWGMAGLLHDIDVEITQADPFVHGQKAIEILTGKIDEEIIDAIALHNECSSGRTRSTLFHHALAAGETITGLITATTLVYPDKKLASVKPKSVVKRMKEKAFAASVRRESILECEMIGIPLDEFATICVEAMKTISEELDL